MAKRQPPTEADKIQTVLNLRSAFWGVTVNKGIVKQIHGGSSQGPLAGAKASIESGGPGERYTLTRLALLGVFALAVPKAAGSVYLTIEGDGYYISAPVPARKQPLLRQWVATFNTLSSALAAAESSS